ncbi:MAG: hypothetical protein ACKOTB_04640 [Planctomycetia bacterium]
MAAEKHVPAAAKKGAPPAESPGDDRIVFRCRNGHRIVAKAAMAGQRGKCSKCGVSVNIPTQREPDQPVGVAVEEPQAVGPPDGSESEGADLPADAATAAAAAESGPSSSHVDMFAGLADVGDGRESSPGGIELSSSGSAPSAADVLPAQGAGAAHSTVALVTRLFDEAQQGAIVELHIEGGSVILPEFFDSRWSTGSHGLFASRAADGTITMTAVAWDAVQKIVVRQVDGLPDGLFE